MGNGIKIMSTLVITLLMGTMLVASNASAATYFDHATIYDWTPSGDGTWGESQYDCMYTGANIVGETRADKTTGYCHSYVTSQNFNAWGDGRMDAWVQKQAICSSSGYYHCYLDGSYDINLMSSGVGLSWSRIWFEITANNVIVASTLVFDQQKAVYGFDTYTGSFTAQLDVYLNYGTIYEFRIILQTYSCGAGGCIGFADAWENEYARVTHVRMIPYTVGGGGGCVNSGTIVAMADGSFKDVKNLNVGDEVLSYNTTTDSIVVETVTEKTRTRVDNILSINNGLLEVTSIDQPIYARNSTFQGWIHDPCMLYGMEIYMPLNNTWVAVTDVGVDSGHYWVYDVKTSGPNTFIGNGVLLDQKTQ